MRLWKAITKSCQTPKLALFCAIISDRVLVSCRTRGAPESQQCSRIFLSVRGLSSSAGKPLLAGAKLFHFDADDFPVQPQQLSRSTSEERSLPMLILEHQTGIFCGSYAYASRSEAANGTRFGERQHKGA